MQKQVQSVSPKIYWQQQGIDQLCAVHAVNSLLQGPFFDQVSLAQIALQLDNKQKQLMQQQGITNDYLKYMAEESGNVALSGNYSIQVIHEALKTLALEMLSIGTQKNEDLTNKQGFICNSVAHWFTIRKVQGVWYNLNSCTKRLPEIISDFYLSAFLSSIKDCGYQIFSVEGVYPQSSQSKFQHYNKHQRWIPSLRIHKYQQKRNKRKGYKPNIGGGNDEEMEKAMAASLGEKYHAYVSSGEDSDWDQPEGKKKEIKEFAGMGVSMGGDIELNYEKFNISTDDIEMLNYLRESLQEHFAAEKVEQGVTVSFRFPNGSKERRVFPMNQSVETLYDFVWCKGNVMHKFYLVLAETKDKLTDLSIPLMAFTDDNDFTVFVQDI